MKYLHLKIVMGCLLMSFGLSNALNGMDMGINKRNSRHTYVASKPANSGWTLFNIEKNRKTKQQTKQLTLLARVTAYWARGKGSDGDSRHHNAAIGKHVLRYGHCAVDPRKIPYHSKVVYPDGEKDEAVDTGRDVRNRKAARRAGRTVEEKNAIVVDKFFETRSQALAWSRRHPLFMAVAVILPH
jgi:3D (Asp-Asp-Asp) domain-containing protein